MKEMIFNHSSNYKGYISKYIISRDDERMTINSDFFPSSVKNKVKLNENIKFYVKDIPEMIRGILFVFRAPMGRGEYFHINDNDIKLTIFMDTERGIKELSILNDNNDDGDYININFDDYEIPFEPEKRTPNKIMIWLMDSLNEEYEAWKKEQSA